MAELIAKSLNIAPLQGVILNFIQCPECLCIIDVWQDSYPGTSTLVAEHLRKVHGFNSTKIKIPEKVLWEKP